MTDYALRTGLFLGKCRLLENGFVTGEEGGVKQTTYLVPSNKLHLPILLWTSFQEMLQPE